MAFLLLIFNLPVLIISVTERRFPTAFQSLFPCQGDTKQRRVSHPTNIKGYPPAHPFVVNMVNNTLNSAVVPMRALLARKSSGPYDFIQPHIIDARYQGRGRS
jgi:hypothetical protein